MHCCANKAIEIARIDMYTSPVSIKEFNRFVSELDFCLHPGLNTSDHPYRMLGNIQFLTIYGALRWYLGACQDSILARAKIVSWRVPRYDLGAPQDRAKIPSSLAARYNIGAHQDIGGGGGYSIREIVSFRSSRG